jgi:excisionase family DNA binding protein
VNGRNRELFAHLALALSRYERESCRDGQAVPPELGVIRAFVMDCAQQRQDATRLGDVEVATHDEGMTSNPMLTRRETAAALRCSARTVDRLIASGALVAVKVEGSTRVRRIDLETYIANLSPRSFRDDVTSKDTA